MRIKALTLIVLSYISFSCKEDEKIKEPVADFSFTSDDNFISPTQISFTNKSINTKEYTWDFGDGTPTSDNINPIHMYTSLGNYTVTLIASNGNLIDQINKQVTILTLPLADFTFISNNDFKAPSEITFTNISTTGESYMWTFGDGTTSTLSNPTHVYTDEGTYSVKLKVTNAAGQSEKTESIIIASAMTEEQNQLKKISETWSIVSATLDGTDRSADFTNFKIIFSGTYNPIQPKGPYSYSVSGTRPTPNPWPPVGTLIFGLDATKDLLRQDSPDLNINYTLTDTLLTISFNYAGSGFVGSRTLQVSGDWIFTFTK